MAARISSSLICCFHFFGTKSGLNTATADTDCGQPLLAGFSPHLAIPLENSIYLANSSVSYKVYINIEDSDNHLGFHHHT